MDTIYDEDLSENEFLQELKQRYEAILQQVIQKGWIICVPRRGSFADHRFQDDEINAHVLIPRQDPSTAQFDTMNGREVLLVDRVLIIKHGDAEQHSTRLLFKETFYNKDLCKYCVWCIDRPLDPSMYISDNCVSVITNIQEAVHFLQVEVLEKELCGDLQVKIKDFLCVNRDLDCKPMQVQKDSVHGLYSDCLRILLENATSREKISSSRHYYWNIRVSLETYILYALRHVLLKSLSACTAAEDAALNKIIRNLDEIQLNDLRVRSDLQSRVQEARLELSRLDCFVTVMGKIECLKRTVNYISRGTSSTIVSSDDFLPVLVFLVIKAGLSNWIAQLTFMKQFRFSAGSVHEADESTFLITSLEATIEHVRSGVITRKYAREFANTRTHVATSQSERSSVDYLFACIKKGDLSEMKKIFIYGKSNRVVTLCHPLCTCATCERNWTRHRDLNVSDPKDDRDLTPLHVAILYDQTAIVDFLLDQQMDVNVADSEGLTALHYACIRGHQGTLLRVLQMNANPTMTDAGGNTPLHLAVDRGHESCVKALLYLSEQMRRSVNASAANENGDTALHLAAKWGYGAIVRILLECGADCKRVNKKGQTPLTLTYSKYIAESLEYYTTAAAAAANIAANDSLQLRQSMLFQRQRTVSGIDMENQYALHRRAKQQHTIDRLLAAIMEGDTCLACYYLGLEVYRKRSPDGRGADGSLCHPLCDCERCSTIGESFLEHRKRRRRTIAINACDSHGETALHVASATGRTEIVRLLLDAGANVNATTVSEGRTPLHLACLKGNLDAARLLLNCATCDVDAKDHDGDTPLHLVTRAGDVKLVGLLLRHGANTGARNRHNMTPLRQLQLEMSDLLSANYADIISILKRNSAPQSTLDE